MTDTPLYVRFRGRLTGPYPEETLHDMVRRGQLTPLHELSADRRRWWPAARSETLFPDEQATASASPSTDETPAEEPTVTLDETETEPPDLPRDDTEPVTGLADTAAAATGPADAPAEEPAGADERPAALEQESAPTDQSEEGPWYYIIGGETFGPTSADLLRALLQTGQLTPDTWVWRPGLDQWRRASEAGPSPSPEPGPAEEAAPRHSAPVRYGGFWVRTAAAVIDSVVLLPIWIAVAAAIGYVHVDASLPLIELLLRLPTVLFQAVLAGVVLIVVYGSVFEASRWQATLGKRAAGLVVADGTHRRITALRSVARQAAKLLSGLPMGVGYLVAAFTQKNRALHDMIAGTLVLRA